MENYEINRTQSLFVTKSCLLSIILVNREIIEQFFSGLCGLALSIGLCESWLSYLAQQKSGELGF